MLLKIAVPEQLKLIRKKVLSKELARGGRISVSTFASPPALRAKER